MPNQLLPLSIPDPGRRQRLKMPSDDDLSGEDENRRPSSAHDTPGGLEAQPPVMEKKRRKNRKRTVAARGPTAMSASRGTGFEEYYADPPITPAEAQEERVDIYAPELSFEQFVHGPINFHERI